MSKRHIELREPKRDNSESRALSGDIKLHGKTAMLEQFRTNLQHYVVQQSSVKPIIQI